MDQGKVVRETIAGQDACYLAKLYDCETYITHALLAMDGGSCAPRRTWRNCWRRSSGTRGSPMPPSRWRR